MINAYQCWWAGKPTLRLGRKNRIYLLLIYPKNVQDNLTDEQRKMLKSVVSSLE